MRKKTVITIISILLTVVFLAGVVYHFPWPTKIDKTLTMTKLDTKGNEVGAFELHLTGTKLNYLFQEDRYVIKADEFDNIKHIKNSDSGDNRFGIPFLHFGKEWGKEYSWLYLAGYAHPDVVLMRLYFTQEQDRYALVCTGGYREEWSYVGSLSGNYTTQEIVEYYKGFVLQD